MVRVLVLLGDALGALFIVVFCGGTLSGLGAFCRREVVSSVLLCCVGALCNRPSGYSDGWGFMELKLATSAEDSRRTTFGRCSPRIDCSEYVKIEGKSVTYPPRA